MVFGSSNLQVRNFGVCHDEVEGQGASAGQLALHKASLSTVTELAHHQPGAHARKDPRGTHMEEFEIRNVVNLRVSSPAPGAQLYYRWKRKLAEMLVTTSSTAQARGLEDASSEPQSLYADDKPDCNDSLYAISCLLIPSLCGTSLESCGGESCVLVHGPDLVGDDDTMTAYLWLLSSLFRVEVYLHC